MEDQMARILITGCSSGFGLAMATDFAKRGDVVFAGLRNDVGTAAQILREAGAIPVAIDVLDPISVERGGATVLAEGPLDALVNNAGILLKASVEDTSDAQAHRMFETNFFGALRMTQAVLPSMRQRQSGVIVNISSLSGMAAMPSEGIYAATKFALVALSEALRHEVKPFGVRVCLVEPGSFPTTHIADNALTSARHFGSPYQEHVDGFWEAVRGLQSAAPAPDPNLVTAAVRRAIHDPKTPFQQPVGTDAETVAAARRAQPFEGFESMLYQSLRWKPVGKAA
jgi:NAD(P)-dependent dehydrogenase (short-subunit alcohol dehydrogenase family)